MTTPPDMPPTAPRRSAGKWLALSVVWALGFVSWMAYIALGVMILYRVF